MLFKAYSSLHWWAELLMGISAAGQPGKPYAVGLLSAEHEELQSHHVEWLLWVMLACLDKCSIEQGWCDWRYVEWLLLCVCCSTQSSHEQLSEDTGECSCMMLSAHDSHTRRVLVRRCTPCWAAWHIDAPFTATLQVWRWCNRMSTRDCNSINLYISTQSQLWAIKQKQYWSIPLHNSQQNLWYLLMCSTTSGRTQLHFISDLLKVTLFPAE